ncbi:MAG: FAD-binding oxidoreductase [Planctomycetota bacterium]
MTTRETTVRKLEQLLARFGAEAVRDARDEDAVLGARPGWVLSPADEVMLQEMLRWADESGQAIAPVGGRTQLDVGNAPERLDGLVSLERMSGIVDYPAGDLTITVLAGTSAGEIARATADQGQWSPLDAHDELATAGGLLAVGHSGMWRPHFGELRDQALETRVVHSDGRVTRSGARVVKNVTGYDLNKLFVGSLGTLGVLSQVCLRLKPKPEAAVTLHIECGRVDDAIELASGLRRAGLDPAGMVFATPDQAMPSPGSERVVGVIELLGSGPDVSWVASRIEELAPSGCAIERLEPEVGSGWWQWLRKARATTLSGLLGLRPDAIGALASKLPSDVAWTLRPFEGRLEWSWDGADSEANDILDAVRAIATEHGAGWLLRSAPLDLRGRNDVFGERPATIELQRRLREAFDPNRNLNPGRFLRGL